jgi:hypothetical protein
MNSKIDAYETVKIGLVTGLLLAVPCSCLLARTWLRRSGRWPLVDDEASSENMANTPPSPA